MTKLIPHLLLGLSLTGVCAFGADESPAPAAPPAPLTVHDLLVDALNANLELQAKRIDPRIQQFRVQAAWGTFDPSLGFGSYYTNTDQPQNQRDFLSTGSVSRIYDEKLLHYETGLTGKLPTGASYTVSTSVERSDNTFNQQITALYHPEYTSRSTFSLTQPLLRDFGPSSNLAEVRLGKNALSVSKHELDLTVIKVVANVMNAYDEMVFGQENVIVKQQAVALAEDLVRESGRRMQEGKMSMLDEVQAKQRLSEAQEELVMARNFLVQRRNTLRSLTQDSIDFNDGDWMVDGAYLTHEAPRLNRDRLLLAMFEHNPSYLAGLDLVKAEDIRIAYAKNQRWPHIDLKASISEIGLNKGWTRAYKDVSNRDTPTWTAGVVVNVPITGRTERARLGEAKIRKRQALLNLKQTEVQLLSAFDTAFRDIASAQERVELVHSSVEFAETALHAEEKRLANGTTTSYNVGVLQKDLSTARSRELATFVDLNKSITGLFALIGTLPDRMQLDVRND